MALSFLNGDYSLELINHTNIVLILKVKKPTMISKFHLISLCNVRYKKIAKTLALRMQKALLAIIDEVQSAFVKDRLITNNVIVAFEAVH